MGGYSGLCPSEYSTGTRRRQGSISKHGNPRMRHLLVEAARRLLRWQPDYPPLKNCAGRSAPVHANEPWSQSRDGSQSIYGASTPVAARPNSWA
ncbi:MAG: IS110 family transposase [Opitutaceae bacterium]|nr:IS110 family transposase [Opitutaceae bacterium]